LQIQVFSCRDRKIGPQKKLLPYFGFKEEKIQTVKRMCIKETVQRNLTDGRKRGGFFVLFSVEKIWRSAKSTPSIRSSVFRELDTYVLPTRWFTRILRVT
jgi:hypothetical protein